MRTDIVNGIPKDAERWLYEALHSLALNQQSAAGGFAALIRGELPDGSGTPLFNDALYVKLLGRPGGQSIHGDTISAGSMTLSSTNHGTKGFIYLGEAQGSAFDETQVFLGLGTAAPTARFHAHLSSTGTSGVNQIGTHFSEYSVSISAVVKNILALAAYANNESTYDVAFISGGSNPVNGIGSIYFTDFNATASNGTGLRFAYGPYGGDTVIYTHLQYGGLNNDGSTKNRNALFCGFNDNCGGQFMTHAVKFDMQAEGAPLAGSAISGRSFSATNVMTVGINSPSAARTSTSTIEDQPVVVIGGGAWFASYHSVVLRLVTGQNFPGSDGAQARYETFQIRNGGGLSDGADRACAIDSWGRICLYNPGNGALTSRLSGRLMPFSVEQDASSSTTLFNFGVGFGINAFTDGSGIGTSIIYIGEQWTSVRWGAISSKSTVVFDRFAIHSKLTMFCDGTLTSAGDFSVPNAMIHIKSALATTTRLLALQRKASQVVDMVTLWDSDGSTALSGFTSAGAYYLIAGAGVGKVLISDAGGVGSWTASAALSKGDDTNVTLTLTGSPSTALLAATTITAGWTGTLAVARGGTGSGTAADAFAALSPLTTLGDILIFTTLNTRLAGNTTAVRQFLSQTGTGTVSAAPIWIGPLASTDLPSDVAYTDVANAFVRQQTIDPSTDVASLLLKGTNQSAGSPTSVPLGIIDQNNVMCAWITNNGRFQLGIGAGDTTHDGIVRLSMNVSPTQTVNIAQCTDGTNTLFSIGRQGTFIYGQASYNTPDVVLSQWNLANFATGTVTNCTIAGDGITVTTSNANGFKLIRVGMPVSGTGIPANTKVLSLTDSVTIVLDTASTPGGPETLTFTGNRTTNVFRVVMGDGAAMFRMQANGNILIGGSSTASGNNGFEKLTVQCSASETTNLVQFTSGLTGATAVVWNLRAVMATGRIKTAVLFTDDNATVASAKLMGFDVSNVTAGQTRTLTVSDGNGTIATDANVLVDADSGDVLTYEGDLLIAMSS